MTPGIWLTCQWGTEYKLYYLKWNIFQLEGLE